MYRENTSDETVTSLPIRETIRLVGATDEFIHIETNTQMLAKAFGKFAEIYGISGDEAELFFSRNVHTSFGSANEAQIRAETNLFDKALAKASMFSGETAACLIPNPDDEKLELIFDIEKISEKLPIMVASFLHVTDYASLRDEVKIQVFESIVNSVAEHEFVHILQYLRDKEDFMARKNTSRNIGRWALSYTALGVPTAFAEPEVKAAYAAGTLALVGAALFLNKDGVQKLEDEAYEIQFKSIRENKHITPFNFSVEHG